MKVIVDEWGQEWSEPANNIPPLPSLQEKNSSDSTTSSKKND